MSTTGYSWLNAGDDRINELKPTTLRILTGLVHMHREDVGCFVSQIRIARYANVSRSTVNTHLDILERQGFIIRERGGLVGPLKSVTRYYLPFEGSFERISRASKSVDKPVGNLPAAPKLTGADSARPPVQNLESVIRTHINNNYMLSSLEPPVIQHCLAACGPGLCSRSRLIIRNSDYIVIEWLAAGYSLEHDVLPLLRRRTARMRRRPIRTWSYFSKAVAEAHTRRLERERRKIAQGDDADPQI